MKVEPLIINETRPRHHKPWLKNLSEYENRQLMINTVLTPPRLRWYIVTLYDKGTPTEILNKHTHEISDRHKKRTPVLVPGRCARKGRKKRGFSTYNLPQSLFHSLPVWVRGMSQRGCSVLRAHLKGSLWRRREQYRLTINQPGGAQGPALITGLTAHRHRIAIHKQVKS